MARSVSDTSPTATAESRRPAHPVADSVSIIICTKNRPSALARAIDTIRRADAVGRSAEIVVVEEAPAPREIEGVRYVHLPPHDLGYGYARNAGLRAARGSVLLFIDDDCEADAGWAEGLLAPLRADAALLGVAGAVLVRRCNAIGYAESILGFPGGGLRYRHAAAGRVVPTRYLSTCNCAYRRVAIERAGGFSDHARRGGEDFLLAERVARLGPCVYAPDAIVYHQPRGSIPAVFRWFVRRGESEIDLLRPTRDRGRMAGFLLRSSWTLRLVALAFVLLRWPWLAPALPPALVAYGAVILIRFRFALRYPAYRPGWLLLPLVKVTMDLGAEWGRWQALLLRRRA